jgi:Zn finger protein HypA/HybF involved in hydrogenase expression
MVIETADGRSWNIQYFLCSHCDYRAVAEVSEMTCPHCHKKWDTWKGARWDEGVRIEIVMQRVGDFMLPVEDVSG